MSSKTPFHCRLHCSSKAIMKTRSTFVHVFHIWSPFNNLQQTARELLDEAQRLIIHINNPNTIQQTFMETVPFVSSSPFSSETDVDCSGAEHSVSPSTVLKRRAQALVIFVGLAMKPKKLTADDQSSISPLVAQLISLATVDANSSAKLDGVFEAARSSLHKILGTMSVFDFVESVESILQSEDIKVPFLPSR